MSEIRVVLTYPCDGCGKNIDIPFLWHAGTVVPQASVIDVRHLEWDAEKRQLVNIETMPDVRNLLMCEDCRVEFTADIIACLLRIREKVKASSEGVTVQ